MCRKILFSLAVCLAMSLSTALHAESVVIESLEMATSEQRARLSQMVFEGLDLQVEEGRYGQWIVHERGKDWGKAAEDVLVTAAALNYAFSDEEDDSSGALLIGAIVGSIINDAIDARRIKNERFELAEFLSALIVRHPEDQNLLSAAENYAGYLDRNYSGASKVTGAIEDALYAVRMGLKADTWQHHPDLKQLIKENHLDNWVDLVGHTFDLNEDNVPMLLYEGVATPWTTIKERLELDDEGMMTDHYYSKEGFTKGKPDAQLVVLKQEDPSKYGKRYIFEVVSYTPSFVSHVWLRLVNPAGDVYSVGFLSDDSKWKSWMNWVSPDVSKGRVFSPTPYEVKAPAHEQVVTAFEIDEDQYNGILKFLDEYQQDPDVCFEGHSKLGTTNCVGFVRVVMEQLQFPSPDGSGWLTSADDLDYFVSWQKSFNKKRDKAVKKLRESGASDAEVKKMQYSWVD